MHRMAGAQLLLLHAGRTPSGSTAATASAP